MNIASRQFKNVAPADADEEGRSLPAWIYHEPEFFELEKRAIFRSAWQLVCHLNDIPAAGDFHSFEFLGESAIVVRADNGEVRAFHNVCRHRAARHPRRPEGQLRPPHHLPVSCVDLRVWTAGWSAYPTVSHSAVSIPLATASRRSSTRSSWDSFSCVSSRDCRACARWLLPTRTSWPPIAWRSWCRRDA